MTQFRASLPTFAKKHMWNLNMVFSDIHNGLSQVTSSAISQPGACKAALCLILVVEGAI